MQLDDIAGALARADALVTAAAPAAGCATEAERTNPWLANEWLRGAKVLVALDANDVIVYFIASTACRRAGRGRDDVNQLGGLAARPPPVNDRDPRRDPSSRRGGRPSRTEHRRLGWVLFRHADLGRVADIQIAPKAALRSLRKGALIKKANHLARSVRTLWIHVRAVRLPPNHA